MKEFFSSYKCKEPKSCNFSHHGIHIVIGNQQQQNYSFYIKEFLKVLYNFCTIKNKNIFLEQYSRIHMDGPKIATCETASDSVFVINTSFASNDTYFHHALSKAFDAFNATMLDFGYTQKLDLYNPTKHQVQPPQKYPF